MARDSNSIGPQTEAFPSLTAEQVFAANLAATVGSERPGVTAGWAEAQRNVLPAKVREFLPRLGGFWWPTMGMVDFLCLNGLFQDPDGFLDDVALYPIEQFLAVLFNGDLSPAEAHSLTLNPAEIESWAPRLSRFSQGTTTALRGLFSDPEGHRRGLLSLIKASDTALFREEFAALQTQSEETVRTIVRRLQTEDPLQVAESLIGKLPDHGPRTYERYTFVPSRLIGHHDIKSWVNAHATFFVQEGGLTLTGPTETGAELAEFLKVLGDKTRIDILRLLCCRPSYGKEIAASLSLTTATVSRHLDQLKAAGLVSEERADTNNVKRLRYLPESLEAQLERLKTYLLHS